MSVIGTAYSGMQAGLMRLQASASNIANAGSTGSTDASASANGGQRAYQPLTVEQAEVPGGGTYSRLGTIPNATVIRHDPSSPHADEQGLVAAPDVDLASELVDQASAKIAFEANLKVLETGGRTDRTILELWA